MELINRVITVKERYPEIKIVAMGCMHHGAAGAEEALADYWYKKVADNPNTYVILGGDLIDGISEKDKRYTEEEIAPWSTRREWGRTIIDRQVKYALAKWKPITDKILWLHDGGHERKLIRDHNRHVSAHFAETLGVPYAGHSALSRLNLRGKGDNKRGRALTFFTTHGAGRAKTDAAALNQLTKYMDTYAAEVVLSWHTHRRVTTSRRTIGLAAHMQGEVPTLRHYDQIGAACGTFLDSHKPGITGYGEIAGYAPVIPGPVVIHIRPFEKTGMRIWASQAVVERA